MGGIGYRLYKRVLLNNRMLIKERVPSLDGFRAFSIILVVVGHLAFPPALAKLHRYLELGGLGVRFFFVISGFIITDLLIKEYKKAGTINLKNFYIRRILRIFPVYFTYILVIYLIDLSFQLHIAPMAYLSSCFFIQNFELSNNVWLLAHTWSLSVEEQFYLIWPNLFKKVKLQNLFSFWALIIVAGSIARILHYKYTAASVYMGAPFIMHADFIFSGCCLAILFNEKYDLVLSIIKKQNAFYVLLMIIAMWFLSLMEFHKDYDVLFIPTAGTMITLCICNLILYYVVKKDTWGFAILNNKIIIRIGQLSYSIYIWQQLFTSNLNWWITQFPQNIVLIALTAYISYTFIEMPINRLKSSYTTST